MCPACIAGVVLAVGTGATVTASGGLVATWLRKLKKIFSARGADQVQKNKER